MTYVIVKQSPQFHQMSLDEFLFSDEDYCPSVAWNTTNTRTYKVDEVSRRIQKRMNINVRGIIWDLVSFNEATKELHERPRKELYREFFIPKKSGGLRKIDAPEPELLEALRNLKSIFETRCCNPEWKGMLYHSSAFAYIKGRCHIDALKRHQSNESKWFAKFDFSNFFGSTTPEFVMKMMSEIYPFSEVIADERGKEALETAIDLAFLDGGLPQGTPISPFLTNLIMIPIDYKLQNAFRDFGNQKYIYTRYADDILVSSKYSFRYKDVENFILETLREFDAPFTLNTKKTRYGSAAGANWNLGVMLNKDNQITVGHKKKRQFKAMLASYIMDKKNGKAWDKSDIMTMEGYRNYYRMVEKETIDGIVEKLNEKFQVDVVDMIKRDLKPVQAFEF